MLILVRHGRTAYNASRRLLGRLDVGLDELGERQVAALARSSRLQGVRRVVTSPLQRTVATALAIGAACNVEPDVDDRWVEIDYGVYDGLPLPEVPPSVWEAWQRDPEWAPDGGESLGSVARRVRQACTELWNEAADRDIAVVSHVSPVKAALAWGMGLSAETPLNLFVEVASLHRIGPGPAGAPTLLSLNETGDRPAG